MDNYVLFRKYEHSCNAVQRFWTIIEVGLTCCQYNQSGQALLPTLKLRQKGLVPATAALRAFVTSTSSSYARQIFPSGLTPAVKDCFGLHGHSAFAYVANKEIGVGLGFKCIACQHPRQCFWIWREMAFRFGLVCIHNSWNHSSWYACLWLVWGGEEVSGWSEDTLVQWTKRAGFRVKLLYPTPYQVCGCAYREYVPGLPERCGIPSEPCRDGSNHDASHRRNRWIFVQLWWIMAFLM